MTDLNRGVPAEGLRRSPVSPYKKISAFHFDLPKRGTARRAPFPWLFALATLAAIVAGHTATAELLRLPLFHATDLGLVVPIAAGVVFLLAGIGLNRRRYRRRSGVLTLGLALLCVLAADVVAIAAHELPVGTGRPARAIHPWAVPALIVAMAVAIWRKEDLLVARALETRKLHVGPPEPHSLANASAVKHLIMPISPPNVVPVFHDNGAVEFSNGQETAVLHGRDILTDIQSLDAFFMNWQQGLRGLAPHCECLETVWLLGSSGTADDPAHRATLSGPLSHDDQAAAGSAGFMDDFARLIAPYLKRPGAQVMICKPREGKLFFENVDDFLQAARSVIRQIPWSGSDAKESQIVVDTTAGIKAASIAGAILTLNSEGAFQYVTTAAPYETVYLYDMRVEPLELH